MQYCQIDFAVALASSNKCSLNFFKLPMRLNLTGHSGQNTTDTTQATIRNGVVKTAQNGSLETIV